MVHGAVQPLGLDRMGVAEQGPPIRREPARFLGLPSVGELAADPRQDSGEPADGLVAPRFQSARVIATRHWSGPASR